MPDLAAMKSRLRFVLEVEETRRHRLALLNLMTARGLQGALGELGDRVTIFREDWTGAYDVTDKPCPALEHSECTCTDCLLARDEARWIDTMNFIGATTHDGRVVVLLPAQLATPLDPEDAIRAAAWLIAAAELSGHYRRANVTALALVDRILAT